MAQSTQTVDHMTKVKLSVGAGNAPTDESTYEFIVGIGSKGYSPFEYELLGKKVGEALRLTIEAEEVNEFFEHLRIPSALATGALEPIHLYLKIDRIDIPDQAEIIRAMADGAACAEQCCGTHG